MIEFILLGASLGFLVYEWVGRKRSKYRYKWTCGEPLCLFEVSSTHRLTLDAVVESHKKLHLPRRVSRKK